MDSTPFYGERGPIPFFLGRKSSVCKKRLWTKWFYILSQPLFYCHDSNQIDPLHTLKAAHGIDHDDALDALWIVDLQIDEKILAPLLAPAAIIEVIRLDLDAADAQMQPLQAIVDP